MRKYFFALLEVLIAILLSSIIITVLMKAFFQTTGVSKKIEKQQTAVLEKRFFQMRLKRVFNRKLSNLEIKDNVAHFLFDNEIDENPDFSKKVSGSLFLNEERQIILSIEPAKNSNGQNREEVIFENVDKFEIDSIKSQKNDLLAIKIYVTSGKSVESFIFLVKLI